MERPLHSYNLSFQSEEFRKLSMDGSYNTRELGGYKTTDGKSVKWGVLFRSDKLSDISLEDQKYLKNLGIQRIVDFRSKAEKTEDPDKIPEGVAYIEMPIEVDGAMRTKIEAILKGEINRNVKDFLIEANEEFIKNYSHIYSKFLKDLAKEQKPTMFHCTAGKDRAGFAAAITLIAIGVSKEDAINDYMKTNEYTAERIDEMISKIELMSLYQTDGELLRPLLGVEREYLEAAFKAAENEYGSIENYIRSGLNISEKEIQQLRSFLLET
jgi:protein-tyrosine phosphatase